MNVNIIKKFTADDFVRSIKLIGETACKMSEFVFEADDRIARLAKQEVEKKINEEGIS